MARTTIVREVDRCIYCGAVSAELTDEHILPFALGGNAVLKRASCGACQRLTSAIEQHVCRPITGMARVRLGLQTRRPDQRKKVRQQIEREGKWTTIEVDPNEYPSILAYPVFGKPGLLEGRTRTGRYRTHGYWTLGQDADFRPVADAAQEAAKASQIKLAEFRPTMLMNFMAKVGHATAVGLLGAEGFTPMLQGAATSQQAFDDLLGGGGRFPPMTDTLHFVELRQVNGAAGSFIFARLHWFTHLAPPQDQLLQGQQALGPPTLLALVGRPRNDVLEGKLGYLSMARDGSVRHGIVDGPSA